MKVLVKAVDDSGLSDAQKALLGVHECNEEQLFALMRAASTSTREVNPCGLHDLIVDVFPPAGLECDVLIRIYNDYVE